MEARNARMLTESGRGTIYDQSYTEQLIAKWAPYLRGVNDPHKRKVTAMLMENELGDIENQLREDTLSGSAASYTKYLFPILRRVFPNLISNDIVSVQPMTGPVGAVFFYEYKYANTKGSANADDNMIQNLHKNYSSEYIDEESIGTGDGSKYGGASLSKLSATLAWKPVRALDSDAGFVVSITDGSQTITDNGSGAFTGDGTGSINYTTGRVYDILFTAAPGVGDDIVATYWYNSELNDQIPEVNIEVSLETVKAGSRKLRARWSSEATDDFRSLHGLDAEAELVSGLSQQMGLEVDREIINDLMSQAAESDTYDFTPAGQTELEAIRGVLTIISTMSAQIHKNNLRSGANWIVTSPKIGAYFEQLSTHGDFLPALAQNPAQPYAGVQPELRPPSWGPMTSDFGIQLIGTLARRYRVYIDPYMSDDKILMGFKGNSYLDAGYVYAPYVPLQMTQTFQDPDDFSNRKGLRTRYAKKMLRSGNYGVITVTFP